MRMIDFRAWDKKKNEILDVMDIDFSGKKVGVCNVPKRMFKDGELHTIHSIEKDWSEVVLMQSTGLKDKNGVEIYEGDYVSLISFETNSEHKGEIVYARGSFCIEVEVKGRKYKVPFTSFEESNAILEVIGNIYENPELLEEI